jgi:hypothetical protein
VLRRVAAGFLGLIALALGVFSYVVTISPPWYESEAVKWIAGVVALALGFWAWSLWND